MTDELTDKARQLLGVVRQVSGGEWIKRKDIATALNKNQLNPAEMAYLDMLAVQGYIEKQESTKTHAPSGRVWLYRASAGE